MVPSKGLRLQYNTDLTATPTDPDWTDLGCVIRIAGVGGTRVETAEHRCLDQTADFVERYPTGFKTAEDATITVSYTGAKYVAMRAFVDANPNVPVLWRLTYPKEIIAGVPQTAGATEVWQAYVTAAVPTFQDNGELINLDITLSPKTKPVFAAGT